MTPNSAFMVGLVPMALVTSGQQKAAHGGGFRGGQFNNCSVIRQFIDFLEAPRISFCR